MKNSEKKKVEQDFATGRYVPSDIKWVTISTLYIYPLVVLSLCL